MRTCGRCGIADDAVLDLDTGGAFHPELLHCINRLRAEVEDVRRERDEARAANERDRTGYSRMVSSLRAHVMRWSGIASSRGPYEWDDEEYFKEFGRCLKELAVIADRGEKSTHATDWTDCPTTQTEVDAARRALAQKGSGAR